VAGPGAASVDKHKGQKKKKKKKKKKKRGENFEVLLSNSDTRGATKKFNKIYLNCPQLLLVSGAESRESVKKKLRN
jgi:hypothetical protein